jgi:hypothetical protein
MKGENYLFFSTPVDEPNAADECIMIPASSVLSIVPGNLLIPGLTTTTLFFKGLANTGVTRGSVVMTHTSGKYKELCDDLVSAINSTVSDGFVNMFNGFQSDIPNASNLISAIVIDSEV